MHRSVRLTVLWAAFVFVHALVAWLGFVLPNQPMGDVYLVYEPWARQALEGVMIPGIDAEWIYPPVALAPMILALVPGVLIGYVPAWALLVTVSDALAFALLVGRGTSRGRVRAAWFWLAFIALLGPVGMYRLDGITVPLALAGCLWLVGRPWLGAAVLTVATWIKVWPAALLAAAVVALRHARRLSTLGATAVVSAVVMLVVVALGGALHAFGFVVGQTGRGLQVEAPVSLIYLWQAVLGVPGASVYYDPHILTFQVSGDGIEIVVAAMTPLLALVLAAVVAVGVAQVRRGVGYGALFPPLSLALVLAFIVFNKVGSPQYLTWLIVPIAIGLVLDRRSWGMPALAALVSAALTFAVYPVLYDRVLAAEPLPVAILTVRNLLLVVLFVWSVSRLTRVAPPTLRHPVASVPDAAASRPREVQP